MIFQSSAEGSGPAPSRNSANVAPIPVTGFKKKYEIRILRLVMEIWGYQHMTGWLLEQLMIYDADALGLRESERYKDRQNFGTKSGFWWWWDLWVFDWRCGIMIYPVWKCLYRYIVRLDSWVESCNYNLVLKKLKHKHTIESLSALVAGELYFGSNDLICAYTKRGIS